MTALWAHNASVEMLLLRGFTNRHLEHDIWSTSRIPPVIRAFHELFGEYEAA
jgi:hypothetical protein